MTLCSNCYNKLKTEIRFKEKKFPSGVLSCGICKNCKKKTIVNIYEKEVNNIDNRINTRTER
jgi:hypothetical protein